MSDAQTTPLKIELESADDNGRYLVYSKVEIAYILKALAQKKEIITAYYGAANEFILTAILKIDLDNAQLFFDVGNTPDLNQKMLHSDKIIFVSSHEKIKVQFIASRVELTQLEGQAAFVISFPTTLLKLQRREYYRLTMPTGNRIKCAIPIQDGGTIEVSILDISVGGIGLIGYPPEIQLSPGNVYKGCTISLPGAGTIVTNLQIRSAFDVTLKNGVRTHRSGCEFVNLPGNMQTLLQRYIIKLEREKRSKFAG